MDDSFFGNWLRFRDDRVLKAHEIAKEWRQEYFTIDADLNKARRAVEMHPEKYVMGFTIQPAAIYNHQLAKAKYEMGIELAKILNSQPEPIKPHEKKKKQTEENKNV